MMRGPYELYVVLLFAATMCFGGLATAYASETAGDAILGVVLSLIGGAGCAFVILDILDRLDR